MRKLAVQAIKKLEEMEKVVKKAKENEQKIKADQSKMIINLFNKTKWSPEEIADTMEIDIEEVKAILKDENLI